MLFASTINSPADAPLAAVYDGGAPARAALALAARLSERERKRLLVFVLGDSPAAFAEHEIAVREQLRALGAGAAIQRVRGTGLADIVRAARTEPVALLVVGSPATPPDDITALDMLVEQCTCTVLVVRR